MFLLCRGQRGSSGGRRGSESCCSTPVLLQGPRGRAPAEQVDPLSLPAYPRHAHNNQRSCSATKPLSVHMTCMSAYFMVCDTCHCCIEGFAIPERLQIRVDLLDVMRGPEHQQNCSETCTVIDIRQSLIDTLHCISVAAVKKWRRRLASFSACWPSNKSTSPPLQKLARCLGWLLCSSDTQPPSALQTLVRFHLLFTDHIHLSNFSCSNSAIQRSEDFGQTSAAGIGAC